VTEIREYNVVRVVNLRIENRPFDGTAGVMRPPRIGDIGAVVHEYRPIGRTAPVRVENVDEDGMTIWLADFERDELELVSSGPRMEIEHLSNEEVKIIGDCLAAAVEGPFFPEWEFQTLFGLERADVARVSRSWPNISVEDEIVDLAVNNALGNLTGYPHGEDLSRFISATPERLSEILEKWKRIQQRNRAGVQ
jgi:hypothetical protein